METIAEPADIPIAGGGSAGCVLAARLSELHGKSGPIPIRRHRREHWTGYTRAVADSFAAMGYPMLDDQGCRASAAVMYLPPETVMAVGPPYMDRSMRLRRRFMAFAMESERSAEVLAQDDAALERHLRRSVGGTRHARGACRMGDPAAPMSVTDPSGRVLGVEGPRVCDASIMPTVPCANLNISVPMMAEKISDSVKAEARA